MSLPPDLVASSARLDELDDLTTLVQAASLEESGRKHFTREQLETSFSAPGFEMDRDTLAVRDPAGSLAGLEWVAGTAPFVRFHATGFVAPHRLGEGIGTAMLEWAGELATSRLAQAPHGTRVSLSTSVDTGHQPSMELMRGAGWELVRHFLEMRADFDDEIPPPSLPEGLIVRTFTPGDDDAIAYRAIDDAFRDHFGHVERPFEAGLERFRHWMTSPSFDPSLWWLAFEGETVVGACLCQASVEDDVTTGYVASLSVRKPWRGRGIAKALLRNALRELQSRDRTAATLHVDAESLTGATRLYETVGMYETERYASFEVELRPGEDLAVR